jgi:polygalacturonase
MRKYMKTGKSKIRLLIPIFSLLISGCSLIFPDNDSQASEDGQSLKTEKIFKIRDFGAKVDGQSDDAEAINLAIKTCSDSGGGVVLFTKGTYSTGSIHLKSNVSIVLDSGAVVKALPGVMDPWEYNIHDQGLMDAAYYHWEASLIWGKNLENIKISGPGTLDGSALTRSSKVPNGTGDKCIALKLCKNIEIEDLKIIEGGHYAILATGCEDLLIQNVHINTSRDGINLSQCRDVNVNNCYIDAIRYENGIAKGGDDAIKLGSDLSLGEALPCENISVANCTLASGCNTLQFGTETIGTFNNIRFENIQIKNAGKAGIGITSNDGSVIDGITYKNITMEKTFVPIFIKISDVARVPSGTYTRGEIRNISFENISATDCYTYIKDREMTSVIWGKPGTPIENISFENVNILVKGGHPLSEAALQPAENDERFPRKVGAIPAYAMYLRHVKNIFFNDCEFKFEKNDDRPALVIDDGSIIELTDTFLEKGSGIDYRIELRELVENFKLQNCSGLLDVNESATNQRY